MASDINSVTLIGRLTRDPELRQTPGGSSLCEASIAVNGSVKKDGRWEEEPHYFNVTVFGPQGEALAKHAEKGQRIGVIGKLSQRRWEAKDGTKRERVQVTANTVQFMEKSKGTGSAERPPADDGVPF